MKEKYGNLVGTLKTVRNREVSVLRGLTVVAKQVFFNDVLIEHSGDSTCDHLPKQPLIQNTNFSHSKLYD